MQTAVWVSGFTVIYLIVTVVALIANDGYKGFKIPNKVGLPILIVLYFFGYPRSSTSVGNIPILQPQIQVFPR